MTVTEWQVVGELALVGFAVFMVLRQLALFMLLAGIVANRGKTGNISAGWWLHLMVTVAAVTGVIVYYGR